MIPLPNAILGGAQKSGTTTLHRLLETHPRIFFPPRPQEIHFFDLEQNFSRGLAWYRRHFRAWNGQPVIAQTSPLYLYEPRAARRIFEALPEVKLIFILRQPVDRAYSHYWHEVRYGYERLAFEEALAAEPARLRGGEEARRHFSYLDRGRYTAQLARYLEFFGPERLAVVLYDQLVKDPSELARRAARFLGAGTEGWTLPDRVAGERHNAAMVPRFPRVQRGLRRFRGLPLLPRAIDRLNLRRTAYPPMRPETRARLTADFAGEARGLANLLGLDVGAWFGAAQR